MTILALDTTGEHGSIALLRDGVADEITLHAPDGFAHLLFPAIESLLERHGVSYAEIDCFAAAAGPGSFTGVRVGLSAVMGLADAAAKPVVAVSNLEAIASLGTRRIRIPVMDARRDEIFGAVYAMDADDEGLRLVSPEVAMKLLSFIEQTLEDYAPSEPLAGDDPGNHPDSDPCSDPSDDAEWLFRGVTPPSGLAGTAVNQALAATIARIAARRFERGLAQDPSLIDANYVRRSDAELKWTELPR